jgi:hypothetical protein
MLCLSILGADKLPDLPRNEKGEVAFQGVVLVEGASKAELRSRARAWIATTYRSANDVVQLDDVDAGTIIVKGNLGSIWKCWGAMREDHFRHTLTLEIKDGRYRYTFDAFSVTWSGTSDEIRIETDLEKHGKTKTAAKFYSAFADSVDSLVVSLKQGMATRLAKGGDF